MTAHCIGGSTGLPFWSGRLDKPQGARPSGHLVVKGKSSGDVMGIFFPPKANQARIGGTTMPYANNKGICIH